MTEATVLFVDLAGFTALTEAHGDTDAADLAGRFFELTRAALAGDARLVKTIGDAVMIVAHHPVPAVQTVLALARVVESEPMFPTLRAGIHAGPVVEREGDFFGATVNLAARAAAYARSGQILCTESVRDAICGMENVKLRHAGTANFKNVAQPVALYEICDKQLSEGCTEVDPVCRMRVDVENAPELLTLEGKVFYFCSFGCAQKFAQTPELYLPKS